MASRQHKLLGYKKTPIYDENGKYNLDRLRSWSRSQLRLLKFIAENEPVSSKQIMEFLAKEKK